MDIKLSGAETSMLKAVGFSGAPMHGELLLERMKDMAKAEFVDTLSGLMAMDYILSSKVNILNIEDAERASFRVNPQVAKELRDTMRGRKRDEEPRRRRRG